MGFEPTYDGFANRCLTTWLPRRTSILVVTSATCPVSLVRSSWITLLAMLREPAGRRPPAAAGPRRDGLCPRSFPASRGRRPPTTTCIASPWSLQNRSSNGIRRESVEPTGRRGFDAPIRSTLRNDDGFRNCSRRLAHFGRYHELPHQRPTVDARRPRRRSVGKPADTEPARRVLEISTENGVLHLAISGDAAKDLKMDLDQSLAQE